MCIEFHGIQHFEPILHMGGNKGFLKRQKNDKIKKLFCMKNNINFFQINYKDKIIDVLTECLKIKN